MSFSNVILIIVTILPFLLNGIAAALTAAGRPKAALMVGAVTPLSAALIAKASQMPADKPKDDAPPVPVSVAATGLMLTAGYVLSLLAVLFVFSGCASLVTGAVVTVNAEEDVLSDVEPRLAGIEGHDLKEAVDAAPDAASAKAATAKIAAKYHPMWVAYDKARAQFVISRLGVATYEGIEATGGVGDETAVLAAVAELMKNQAALEAAVKTLGQ